MKIKIVVSEGSSFFSHFFVMNKKVANFHESLVTTPKVHTVFYRAVLYNVHIFAVSMKTTGAISSKI